MLKFTMSEELVRGDPYLKNIEKYFVKCWSKTYSGRTVSEKNYLRAN
jgi:hypothetical protein